MFAAAKLILTLLATAAIYVRADISPTNPGPGDIFVEGQTCTIGWDVDTSGAWKTMNIDLMTGDNINMVFLSSVAKGLDGTNPSMNTYSFTCPQVSPHSTIYFYEFTASSASNKAWTGRFAITDSTRNTVPPSESTQPDGTKIPWGKGTLVDGNSSSSTTHSPSLGPGPATHLTATATLSAVSGSPSQPNATSSITNTTTSTSSTSTPSTGSSESNGVVASLSASSILFQAGLVLGLAAFGFAVTL